jgi:hypothetical protein
MGRRVAILLAALLAGVALQGWAGAELSQLEAQGAAAAAELPRVRALFWLGGIASFGAALGFGLVLGSLASRTLRSASFPPEGAEWLGARRRYEGAAARRIGWLGVALAALLSAAALAGLALSAALALEELA